MVRRIAQFLGQATRVWPISAGWRRKSRSFSAARAAAYQLVAAGEAPLTIGYGPHAQSFVNQGAPIDWVPLEPVVVIINTVSIAARPPHPAAAKLFIDFLFSKPAQLKLREMSRIPSRSDVEPIRRG